MIWRQRWPLYPPDSTYLKQSLFARTMRILLLLVSRLRTLVHRIFLCSVKLLLGYDPWAHCLTKVVTIRKWLPQLRC